MVEFRNVPSVNLNDKIEGRHLMFGINVPQERRHATKMSHRTVDLTRSSRSS